jgi:two-component system NtrC family sensor kinase
LIEISDTGCGIEPALLPRIFDPFYTTKDVGQGTGLGLSISHNIITGHGGRIDVDSKPGHGTCFRIYLPLSNPS